MRDRPEIPEDERAEEALADDPEEGSERGDRRPREVPFDAPLADVLEQTRDADLDDEDGYTP